MDCYTKYTSCLNFWSQQTKWRTKIFINKQSLLRFFHIFPYNKCLSFSSHYYMSDLLCQHWHTCTYCFYSTWGDHPRIKRLLPLVLSSNSSSLIHLYNSFEWLHSLITQINGMFDASNAKPSSFNCKGVKLHILPRQTSITDFGLCKSSYSMILFSSIEYLFPLWGLSKSSRGAEWNGTNTPVVLVTGIWWSQFYQASQV